MFEFLRAFRDVLNYSPSQPRDKSGKWEGEGSGSPDVIHLAPEKTEGAGVTAAPKNFVEHTAKAQELMGKIKEAMDRGDKEGAMKVLNEYHAHMKGLYPVSYKK